MSCNLFKDNVKRGSIGQIESVNYNGEPSRLYSDILNYVKQQGKVVNDYLSSYIGNLTKLGYILNSNEDPFDISNINIGEYALAIYSRIFTPSFIENHGNWQKSDNSPEPSFEDIKTQLFQPSTVVKNQDSESYDTDILKDISEDVPKLINDGITANDMYDYLTDKGYNINKAVLTKMFSLANKKSGIASELYKDIQSDNYTPEELYAMYNIFGVTYESILNKVESSKSDNSGNKQYLDGSLKGNQSLEGLTEEEKVEKVKNTIGWHLSGGPIKLIEQSMERDGSETGTIINKFKNLNRFFADILESTKDAGRVGNLNSLMKSLEFLLPSLRTSGIKLTLHSDVKSYANSLAKAGKDYVENVDSTAFIKDNEIHIFVGAPLVNGHVAVHEVLHPILAKMLKVNPELYESFKREVVQEMGQDFSDYIGEADNYNPTFEEIIETIALDLQEKIDDTPLNKNIFDLGNQILGKFIRAVVNAFRKLIGSSNTATDFLENTSKITFVEDLYNNLNRPFGMNFEIVHNGDVNFSKHSDQFIRMRNIIVSNPDFYDDSPEAREKFPNQGILYKAAEKLGVDKSVISRAYADVIEKEGKAGIINTDSASTLMNRIENGFIGRWDKRKIRGFKMYLTGRYEDVLPDSVIREFFYAYRNGVPGGYRQMFQDIIASSDSLPEHVYFYMLDKITALGYDELSSKQRALAREEIVRIRKNWGRLGRYMRSELSLTMGVHHALIEANEALATALENSGFTSFQKAIRKAMKFNESDAGKIIAQIKDSDIEGAYRNYTLDQFEVQTTIIQEALESLLKLRVEHSFVDNKSKKQGQTEKEKRDENRSNEEWKKITYNYIILSKGNIGVARAKFQQDFPKYKNKFNPAGYLKPKAIAKKIQNISIQQLINGIKHVAEHTGELNFDLVGNSKNIDAKAVNTITKNDIVPYIIKAALYKLDYSNNTFTLPGSGNYQQAVPDFEAASKLINAIDLGTITLEEVADNAVDYLESELREAILKNRSKKEIIRAKKLLSKAKQLSRDINVHYGPEMNQERFDQLVDREIYDEIKNKIEEYLTQEDAEEQAVVMEKRQSLADKIARDLRIPFEIADDVANLISSQLEEKIKEVSKQSKSLKEGTKLDFKESDLRKLINLFNAGYFDQDAVFEGIASITGQSRIPRDTMIRMVSLKNEHDRAKSEYDRNYVKMKASKFLAEIASTTSDKLLKSTLYELLYNSMLSSPRTTMKAVVSTVSTEGFKRIVHGSYQLMKGIKSQVFENNSSEMELFNQMMATKYAFSDFQKDPNTGQTRMKGHRETMRDFFLNDLSAASMSERMDFDSTEFRPIGDYCANVLKKRYTALKKAKKGDVKGAINDFVDDIWSGDLGSSMMNRTVTNTVGKVLGKNGDSLEKLSLNIRRGIRLSSFLVPLFFGGITMASMGGFTAMGVGSFFAISFLTSNGMAKLLPLADFFMTQNNLKYAAAQSAIAKVRRKSKKGSITSEEFFENIKQELGISSQYMLRIKSMIDEEFPSILDDREQELGRPLNLKESNKLYRRHYITRLMNLQMEYVSPDHVREGMESARDSALIGAPKGRSGQVLRMVTEYLSNKIETQSLSENNNPVSKIFGRALKPLLEVFLKVITLPFANVLVNMFNQAYEFSPLALAMNSTRNAVFGEVYTHERVYDSNTGAEKIVPVGPARVRERIAKNIFGLIAYTAMFFTFFEFSCDDEDSEDRAGCYIKPKENAPIRITGAGTGDYKRDRDFGDGYEPWSIQIRGKEGYQTVLKYSEIPLLSSLSPLGQYYDRHMIKKGSVGLRTTKENFIAPMDPLNLTLAMVQYSTSQSFNQTPEKVLGTALKITREGFDNFQEDVGGLSSDLLSGVFASAINPNFQKDLVRMYQDLEDIPFTRSGPYEDRSFLYSTIKDHPVGRLSYTSPSTNSLGYNIVPDYSLPQPIGWLAARGIESDEYQKMLADESPFFKTLNKYPSIKAPYNSSMYNLMNMDSGDYGGRMPMHMSLFVSEKSKLYRRELLEDRDLLTFIDKVMDNRLSMTDLFRDDYIPEYAFEKDMIERFKKSSVIPGKEIFVNGLIEKKSQEATDRAKVDLFYPLLESMYGSFELAKRDVVGYSEDPDRNQVTWPQITGFLKSAGILFSEEGDNDIFFTSDRLDKTIKGKYIKHEDLLKFYRTGTLPKYEEKSSRDLKGSFNWLENLISGQ